MLEQKRLEIFKARNKRNYEKPLGNRKHKEYF